MQIISSLTLLIYYKYINKKLNNNPIRDCFSIPNLMMELDIWSHIATFIDSNKDRCRLLMTHKEILKANIYFDELINVEKIMRLVWFDRFRNISNVYYLNLLPKFVTKISFCPGFHEELTDKLPSTVTHITFPKMLKKPSIGFLSPNITHLILSQVICCHKMTARNLILNPDFDDFILDKISVYVRHLTLSANFNFYQKDCIPSWVENVTIIGNPSEERLQYIQQFIPEKCKLLIRSSY